ncbi:MAG: hypothetical protein WD688_07305 [Candidatus Binatia bacterium]
MAGRKELSWEVHVVCRDFERRLWRDAAPDEKLLHALPDFGKQQAWEDDPAQVAEIDAFIGECERTSRLSAGRILLTGERDIGRGFSQGFYYWFSNTLSRSALRDNTEPFRIVRRIFAFARSTISAAQPDFLLSGEWADPLCLSFNMVARAMDIPCIVNRPSKLWGGRFYWSDDQQWFNRAAHALCEQKNLQNAPVSERAQERIASFRAKPSTLGYVRKNWDSDDRRGWGRVHLDLARMAVQEVRYRLKGRRGPSPKPTLQLAVEYYRRAWLKARQSHFFSQFSEEALRDKRYIFVALHKDPEQALNGQAAFWSNQYNTVSFLCSIIPAGYSLLVREHRRNTGRRPTRYYKELSRLPNVHLIDGFDDQFKYIANADLIITENGSTGWEGLLLNRRVITLAEHFYQNPRLAHRVRDPELLASTVLGLLSKPPISDTEAHDQALGRLLDAELQTTTPLDDANYSETFKLLGRLLSAPTWRTAETALVTSTK